ncbi:MAG TPA: PEP/pyruvate-binding domain-containing protein [Kofleriaceae bacterium]|nr:PEP/pyruvate-binding domain-containing protein [Kofleriaceae bacterium]
MDAAAPPVDAAVAVIPETAPARRLWTPRLATEDEFLAYSKELGGERFAKFVIDLKSDAVYYFDVDVYKVHKDFIFQELYKKPRTRAANRIFDQNYGSQKTDFMMCYLIHHLNQDAWTFAFWDGDLATADHVRHAYRRMKQTFYNGDKVKFRPDSNYQEGVARTLKDVPVVFNDQLYQAQTFQSFNNGSAVGTLRFVPPDVPESELTFDPAEIVVIRTPLSDITPVAGIISETFSTPLAHVSLRAKGWGIPNIGLKQARDKLAALDGKQVYFEARDADYVVRLATAAEIAEFAARKATTHRVVLPIADLSVTAMATLEQMRGKDVVAYGTKASALGEIVAAKLTGFDVPPGFGVPFAYYAAHLKAHGIDAQIARLLAAPPKDPAARKQQLEALRKAIVSAAPSDELRAKVEQALGELTHHDPSIGVFVRSSTNAEDLATFSGAGLYDTLPNVKGSDAVVAAILQVWASVWNFAAFENRARYAIDHARVYGGVLVQIGVNGTAAGVLVTVHPTDPTDELNYTVNAKSGLGIRVVDGKKVPESLLVSWYNHGIRVLSRSAEDTKLVFDDTGGVHEVANPDAGKPVLTNRMAIVLADTARQLTHVFKSNKLDIEWVFAGDRLNIVQSRPYVTD